MQCIILKKHKVEMLYYEISIRGVPLEQVMIKGSMPFHLLKKEAKHDLFSFVILPSAPIGG